MSRSQNRCGSSHFHHTQIDSFFFLNDPVRRNKTRFPSSHRARCFLPSSGGKMKREIGRQGRRPGLEAGCGAGSEAQQFHLRHAASVPEHGQKWVSVAHDHLKGGKDRPICIRCLLNQSRALTSDTTLQATRSELSTVLENPLQLQPRHLQPQ